MVDNFQGTFGQQIRIVGATEKPASIPYRANMTLLDAMIAVRGLSEYAAGDKARLVRPDPSTGRQKEYDLELASLLNRGASTEYRIGGKQVGRTCRIRSMRHQ